MHSFPGFPQTFLMFFFIPGSHLFTQYKHTFYDYFLVRRSQNQKKPVTYNEIYFVKIRSTWTQKLMIIFCCLCDTGYQNEYKPVN